MERLLKAESIRFIVVGVINTLVGTSIMLGLYNLAGCSYWMSSSINYFLTSILSYFLNRKYTFQFKGNTIKSMVKFALNIAICYIAAYGIAKPFVISILYYNSLTIQENIAMIVGMILFTSFNFIGQKYFAFKKN